MDAGKRWWHRPARALCPDARRGETRSDHRPQRRRQRSTIIPAIRRIYRIKTGQERHVRGSTSAPSSGTSLASASSPRPTGWEEKNIHFRSLLQGATANEVEKAKLKEVGVIYRSGRVSRILPVAFVMRGGMRTRLGRCRGSPLDGAGDWGCSDELLATGEPSRFEEADGRG